ncbi:hypothetical protein [Streptomyces spiramyceticus]|uniref:hypothetical protein n=1 Tax=Streptomyces spiramyceticus TaxID=299717 RepID=UPI00237BE270|nr:hypothetical protein [Streptomyces spiramyceticus]
MTWIPDGLAEAFAAAWTDDILVRDLASRLTCIEVELLATVLRVCGGAPEYGDDWIGAHAETDQPGDQHYRGPAAA